MNNPIITIDLKPHLEDFCRHELRTDKDDNIILHRKNDIAKMIISNICAANYPPKEREKENPVTFVIPKTPAVDLETRFLYVTAWGEEKIASYIEAEFNQRCRRFFEYGYLKGFSQKRITEAILAGYNIKNNAISFEAVKKNDYRKRKKSNQIIFQELQNTEY